MLGVVFYHAYKVTVLVFFDLAYERHVMKLSDLQSSLLAKLPSHTTGITPFVQIGTDLQCLLEAPPTAINSAVLILFYEKNGTVHISATRRLQKAPKPNPSGTPQESIAPGMIVLPGGKLETGESDTDAALREAREEVSARVELADVIGTLPAFWRVLGSKTFRITPVVAVSYAAQDFKPSDEVAEIIEVPLLNWLKSSSPLFPVNADGEHFGLGNAFALAMLRAILNP